MKTKIEIKSWLTGSILFEYECEENTVKTTLLEAIKSSADLRFADLRSANLSYANLSSANLRFADLRSGVNLSETKTDKRYIQIGCIGSSKRMTTYCFEDGIVWCGCFKGTLEEFENKCKETHKDNEQYLKEYTGAINYIKSLK